MHLTKKRKHFGKASMSGTSPGGRASGVQDQADKPTKMHKREIEVIIIDSDEGEDCGADEDSVQAPPRKKVQPVCLFARPV